MSSYNYSYNVLVNRLEAFAAGHYLIKRFTHGQIDLADMNQDDQYPFMHVVPNNIKPVDGGLQFDFQIVFADIPRDKELKAEYQREVISDCVRLAQDLIAEVKNGIVLFGFDVQLVTSPVIEPFQEEYKNTLTGVSFSLQLEVPWDWSACDIPASWAVGGVSTGGNGTGLTGLVLKTNGVNNIVQTMLNLVEGSNVSIVDNGDGSVTISSTGGSTGTAWGDITGLLADQIDLITALNLKADIASLGAVAFSNDYNDLSNLPTIPAAQVNSDWSASSGVAQILNKPTLATVATTGSYTDLINQPSIPAAQVNADWNSSSGLSQILNKPTIPSYLDNLLDVNTAGEVAKNILYFNGSQWIPFMLSAVAYSGKYTDLSNLPAIPKTLTDLIGSGVDVGDIIQWNGTTWIVQTPQWSLEKLTDVNVSGVTAGQVLTWDDINSEWIPTTPATGGTVTSVGLSMPTAFNVASSPVTTSGTIAVTGAGSTSQYVRGDGTLATFPTLPSTIGDMLKSVYDTDNDGIVNAAQQMLTIGRNSTGSTLYQGTIVYVSGSTGNRPNFVKAQANAESTSAGTFGVIVSDIANNSDGYACTIGTLDNLDTRTTAAHPFTVDTLADGDTIYLSPTTAGYVTNVKPTAPYHLVYVGKVVRTTPSNGTIVYRIQNGYELDELHDVQATSAANNDYLYRDTTVSPAQWKTRQLTASLVTDATTVGQALVKLTNPSAISYLRVNADNSVTALTTAQLKAAVGDTISYGQAFVASVAASTTNYGAIAGVNTYNANESNRQFAIPFGGTVKNLYVFTSTQQPATGALTVSVSKNAVNSSVSVSIVNGDGIGTTKSDTSNTLSVSAGDKLTIRINNAATTQSATIVSIAFIIERI